MMRLHDSGRRAGDADRVTATMAAWHVHQPGQVASSSPLVRGQRSVPEAGSGEIRVAVAACGVCRTDLHLAEGDLQPHRPDCVPGHEIVGHVDQVGPGVTRFVTGDRVGIAWLRETCGHCNWCTSGRENLCLDSRYTGWDADGGYAQYAVVRADYAYALPDGYSDAEAAPLLCAGIVGYRALKRAQVGEGGRLGIYGFGASAHLALQVALASGVTVHVLTRSEAAQQLALELGAASAGPADGRPPEPLDGAVLFAPVGTLVPVALAALDQGGTLSVAGIYLSDIPVLNYDEHLFRERTLTSTTSNTRADGEEFLAIAARTPLSVHTVPYSLDTADQALRDLAADRITGAAVLHP